MRRQLPWVLVVVVVLGYAFVDISNRIDKGPSGGRLFLYPAKMPESPLTARERHSGIWTGTEAIYWGGRSGDQADTEEFGDGAVYNPATRSWRTIPAAPLSPRSGHAAVWTGQEMIIWGGSSLSRLSLLDGAAYDPARNTWRKISSAPAGNTRSHAQALWLRDRMIISGGIGTGEGTSEARKKVLIYNTRTKRWAQIECDDEIFDMATDGRSVFVVTIDRARARTAIIQIDPISTRTNFILSPPVDGALQQVGISSSGSRLFFAASKGVRTKVAEYVHGAGWRTLAELAATDFHPESSVAMDPQPDLSVWTGSSLLNHNSFGIESFDPKKRALHQVLIKGGHPNVTSKGRFRNYCGAGAPRLWTGSAVLSWGGQSCAPAGPRQTSDGIELKVSHHGYGSQA